MIVDLSKSHPLRFVCVEQQVVVTPFVPDRGKVCPGWSTLRSIGKHDASANCRDSLENEPLHLAVVRFAIFVPTAHGVTQLSSSLVPYSPDPNHWHYLTQE